MERTAQESGTPPSWRLAASFAAAVFAVVSILPVWLAWYFNDWEGLGVGATFWTMLASVPAMAERFGVGDLAFKYYSYNMVLLSALVAGALAIGRWYSWPRNREKVIHIFLPPH